MSIITRYFLRQLVVGTILVSVGLACILWLTQSLRFVDLMIQKGLSVGAFARLTVLLLPNFLVMILPIAVFSVTLFTYNRAINDREMAVLKAAGASNLVLARPPLILATVQVIACFVLTVLVVPYSVERFREMQWTIRNDVSAVLLQEGVFTQVTRGLTVYVRSRSREGELVGILVHDERSPGRTVTMMAERGALILNDREPRVLMVNGNRQEVRRGDGRLSLLYFDSYSIDIGGFRESDGVRFRDARERSMTELFEASDSAGLQAVDVRRFRVEAHQRLIAPLLNLCFVLVALAALLPAPFNRRGQTLRVVGAVGLMIGIEAAALGAASLATRHLGAVPLLYATVLVPLVVAGVIALRPARRPEQEGSRPGPSVLARPPGPVAPEAA